MNVLAIYVASEMLQAERERAFERAMLYAMPAGPSLHQRIASAAAGLRRIVGSPSSSVGVLPKLEDHPYRG